MEEKSYRNRELDVMFRNLTEKIDNYHTETIGEIIKLGVRVDKTNGSVVSLKAWRTGIGMVVAVLSFLVIPLVVYSFAISQENLRNTILLEVKAK